MKHYGHPFRIVPPTSIGVILMAALCCLSVACRSHSNLTRQVEHQETTVQVAQTQVDSITQEAQTSQAKFESTVINAGQRDSIAIERDTAGRAVAIVCYRDISCTLTSSKLANQAFTFTGENLSSSTAASSENNNVSSETKEVEKTANTGISLTDAVKCILLIVLLFLAYEATFDHVLPWIKKRLQR